MASRAFDDVRTPQAELIDDCVHCGFCLETCPTYSLWHEEMDSPRGRIVLIKEGLEPGSRLSAELVTHIDRCLGCMACVTACPSGVQYDKLIEDTRAQVERHADRPRAERLFRRLVFETFPHPARLRALAPLLAAGRRLGLVRALLASRLLARFPRLRAMVRLAPQTPLRESMRRLPAVTPARRAGASAGRVAPGMRAAGVLRARQRGDRPGARRRGIRGARAERAALLRGAAAALGPRRRGRGSSPSERSRRSRATT